MCRLRQLVQRAHTKTLLQMICGLCWLTFLYPPLGSRVFTFAAPVGLLSVVVMILWLLIRGVDEDKWRSRAATASDI